MAEAGLYADIVKAKGSEVLISVTFAASCTLLLLYSITARVNSGKLAVLPVPG